MGEGTFAGLEIIWGQDLTGGHGSKGRFDTGLCFIVICLLRVEFNVLFRQKCLNLSIFYDFYKKDILNVLPHLEKKSFYYFSSKNTKNTYYKLLYITIDEYISRIINDNIFKNPMSKPNLKKWSKIYEDFGNIGTKYYYINYSMESNINN